MLLVFGDESSDETRQRVFAVAGIIGTEDDWAALQQLWVARTGGVAFHATDCQADKGDYRKIPHEENDALYKDLTILLANSGLAGYGISIDLQAQNKFFPDSKDGTASYLKGFCDVVEALKQYAKIRNETVQFTFDRRSDTQHDAGYLYNMSVNLPGYKDTMISDVAFKNHRDHPRLQVADLLARETMKALDNIVGPVQRPPRKSCLALTNTKRFTIHFYGEDFFRELDRQLPMIVESLNLDREEYHSWLAANKRQDNFSNVLEYTEKLMKK